jgi:hypothetical protein
MYGIIDAVKQANAAQLKYIPFPYDTSIPDVTPWASCMVLTLSAFLTMEVHMAAPIKTKSADRTDNVAERKNKNVFRSTPVNSESAVNIVPSRRKKYAT